MEGPGKIQSLDLTAMMDRVWVGVLGGIFTGDGGIIRDRGYPR